MWYLSEPTLLPEVAQTRRLTLVTPPPKKKHVKFMSCDNSWQLMKSERGLQHSKRAIRPPGPMYYKPQLNSKRSFLLNAGQQWVWAFGEGESVLRVYFVESKYFFFWGVTRVRRLVCATSGLRGGSLKNTRSSIINCLFLYTCTCKL